MTHVVHYQKPIFEEYDFYELYDENKEYTSGKYDYGKGLHNYTFETHEYKEPSSGNSVIHIVAVRVYTEEEIAALAPYCQCLNCAKLDYYKFYSKNGVFATILFAGANLLGLNGPNCACCVGCLKIGPSFGQQYNIRKAEEAAAAAKKLTPIPTAKSSR